MTVCRILSNWKIYPLKYFMCKWPVSFLLQQNYNYDTQKTNNLRSAQHLEATIVFKTSVLTTQFVDLLYKQKKWSWKKR